jgi:RHS repeat-associated protein
MRLSIVAILSLQLFGMIPIACGQTWTQTESCDNPPTGPTFTETVTLDGTRIDSNTAVHGHYQTTVYSCPGSPPCTSDLYSSEGLALYVSDGAVAYTNAVMTTGFGTFTETNATEINIQSTCWQPYADFTMNLPPSTAGFPPESIPPLTFQILFCYPGECPFEGAPWNSSTTATPWTGLFVSEIPDNTSDLGAVGNSACEGICGSPINLTNGNTYIQQNDYSLPGLGGGIQLTRTWNSLWVNNGPWETAGIFGDSWQSNYEAHLQATQSGAKYWRGDGSAWAFTYSGGVYSLTSPPNEHATLTFNSTTNQSTVALSDGTKQVFSQPGYLVSIVDRNGNSTTLNYDGSNRLTTVTDAAARVLSFNYANSSFPALATSIQDAVGTIATYVYDATGHLSSVTYPDASAINFASDTSGLITSTADSQGKVLESHSYDSTRRGLTSQAANAVDSLGVSYNSGVAMLTDSAGNTTQYTAGTQIAMRNFLTSVAGSGCDTCGGRRNYSFTYDTSGNRTSSIDPLGHFTNYTYDANGNVLQKQIQRDSANNTQNWSYTYNSFNEVLTATDPLGNVTTNTYDAKGNMLTATTPSPGGHTSGSTTSLTYDTKGELTKITDPLSHSTTLAYNPVGLISSITDTQSKITQFQYDSRGNRTVVIDALNNQTAFAYDSMNRLTKITYPTSPATYTQFAYDYRGRKIGVTDPNGKITQYGYDDADRLISVTDPNNGETQYAYDDENNLTSITDASGNKTSFVYDPYGQVSQTNFPSSFAEAYSYDLDGNLLTKTDRKGHVINYGYDFLNRLTSKSYPDGTAVNYTYDLENRLTQVSDPTGTYTGTFDNMSRLTQTSTVYTFITGKTFTVGYAYDAASNRSSMTDPQNASTAYVYDTLNRMSTLTYPSRNNYSFTYDALGRRTQLSRPNSVATNYQYDTLSRLTSVLHQISSKSGTTTLDGATYVYDAGGNRTSKTDKRTNVASGFSYDALYELTQVQQGTSTTESYSDDPVGNRLSSLGVSPYAYNTSNQLNLYPGVAYTYDNNGNTLTKVTSAGTTNYSWDFENRLTSVTLPGSGGTVNFKYDPFGRRIQKVSSAGTTNYVYDGVNVLEEVNGSGSMLGRYVQSPGVDQPLAETRGSTTSYYEADGLGSITSLSNSSGALANTYTYDSYGKLVASTGTLTNPFRYTGRDVDSETGLSYYRARYYDPAVGRFISEDPIGFGGGANLYAYVGNDPVDFTDPLGLRSLTDCEKRKLAPFIPKIDLDKADLHPGEVPWYFHLVSKDFEGITRGNDIYFRPGVYDPTTVEGLAKLGHELVHVGQYRNGLTWAKYLWASRHSYDKNPYEKPAYDKQDEIENTMTKEKCGGCSTQ